MPIIGPTTNHTEIRCWAEARKAVPTETLPAKVDSEPAELRILMAAQAADYENVRVLSLEEFFAEFNLLGLTFVYDADSTGYNEILQIEEKSPYRNPKYQAVTISN